MPLSIHLRQALFLVITFLVSYTCTGQKPSAIRQPAKAKPDSTELVILKIRKEYARINADSAKYKVVSKNIDNLSTEGGELTNYYEGGELVKSVIFLLGEMGKSKMEFYIAGDEIFFCYEQIMHYDKPMYMQGSHIEITAVNRYYFNNQKIIRWLDNSLKIVSGNQYAAQTEKLLSLWKLATLFNHEE